MDIIKQQQQLQPQPRRPKQKIEKSNDEFKQHERIIMDKRIAEINNVITKKCHTIWNQYLYFKNKPHTLQFNFVYHGLESYLKKCDDYKPEQHKDNKQKWWNNQKASEMSQQFLPSVLNSTDHMAQYLGKQTQSNLQLVFTNYVTFELLETAITSVFSTQRSGSNEVFLRTSFQYAKAGLRKKLVSYFGDGELRTYDTKSRKKKDLWQRLIKEKKDKLLQMFQHKKAMYANDTKVGIVSDTSIAQINYTNNGYDYDSNNNMYPPSRQQQMENNNGYNNAWKNEQTYDSNMNIMDLNHINNINNLNMSGMNGMNNMNNGTLPFPQPLLMDITLTYPKNMSTNTNNVDPYQQQQQQSQQQQQIPPPVSVNCIPSKTKYNHTLTMNTNPNTMMMNMNTMNTMNTCNMSMNTCNNMNSMNNMHMIDMNMNNINNAQCRQCLQYMSKISDLLKVNGDLNRDSVEIKQLNIKYSAERDHWKSQYQTLLTQYQHLLRQQNELLQHANQPQQAPQSQPPPPLSPQNMVDDEEDIMNNMSVSSKTGTNKLVSPSDNNQNNQSQNQAQIPLDELAKTPKELQPFNINGFICDNSSITPYAVEGINGFTFPNNTNKTVGDENACNSSNNSPKNEDNKSEMSSSIFSHNINNNHNQSNVNSNGKCTVSVAASVMSVCSNEVNHGSHGSHGNHQYLQQHVQHAQPQQSAFNNNNNWSM